MAFSTFSCSDEDPDSDALKNLFGPTQIDHAIRQAIQHCWMGLPKEKRNVDEVERQIRRLVDRALKDVREDAKEFGFGDQE